MPEVFVTAYDALVLQGGLTAGGWALVHAGASGVGTAAIQLARAVGRPGGGDVLRRQGGGVPRPGCRRGGRLADGEDFVAAVSRTRPAGWASTWCSTSSAATTSRGT